ncbi:hypothetical protein QYE76_033580 [Lolium multiflorum]|uniref:CCHC-type domain-containing protein n=1 Tax=Lolium multiflorum TaxID=4521 RepID=A0AAD8QWE3_LOLMU|nr:hypothetical protein QYE76_033580 [Lolium multiflorum]
MSYPEDLEYHYNDHMAFHAKTFWVDPSKAKEDNIKRNNSSGFKSLDLRTRSFYNCGDKNHFIAQCPYDHRETRGGRLIPKDKSKDPKATNKKFYNKEEIKELEAQVLSLKKDLEKRHEGKSALDKMLSAQQSPNDKSGLGFNSNNKNKSKSKSNKKKGQDKVKKPTKLVCFKCKVEGHHVRSCPLKKKKHLSEKQQGKRPQGQAQAQARPQVEDRPLLKKNQDKVPQEKKSIKKRKRNTCYLCCEKGHFASSCLNGKKRGAIGPAPQAARPRPGRATLCSGGPRPFRLLFFAYSFVPKPKPQRDPHEGLHASAGRRTPERKELSGGNPGEIPSRREIDAIAIVIERDIISITIIIISTIYTAITTAAPRHRCSNSG